MLTAYSGHRLVPAGHILFFIAKKSIQKMLGKINSSVEQYFAGPPAGGLS